MTYEEILKKWGKARLLADKPHLDESVEVTSVDVYECEATGYCETCYSPGYIDITIEYVVGGLACYYYINARDNENGWNSEYETLTSLIRELEELAIKLEGDTK